MQVNILKLWMYISQTWLFSQSYKIYVMIWVCLFFSLSHSVVHALTHTHMLTDTYISLFPTCLSFQSAFALLCSATCSHSSNQSLYLQRLRSRLSVGLLYVVHWMCSLVFHSIKISYLVLSRLEMLRVSGAFSVSCCCFQLVLFHEVSLDWFPLDHRLQVLFCIFLSSASTHDRLPCFLLLH